MMMIENFNNFTVALLKAGFSMGGENGEGIYSLSQHFSSNILWHTSDPETDPWEWRMRVLDERTDIAYAKTFFRKSGFITKEWYPFFLAARRGSVTVEKDFLNGTLSQSSKRIYDVISENGAVPVHRLKQLSGFGKEGQSRFERALVDLQMKLYITMCGRQQKISQRGEAYGWSSTVFCTTERFFGADIFEKALALSEQTAIEEITAQIYQLNPTAEKKKVLKFIKG